MIELPLVSLDLELMGSGDDAEIIEIGAVKFRGSETLATLHRLVRPSRPLSYRIGTLTGITADDLRAATPPDQALQDLSRFVGSAPIVGQSIGQDAKHLRRAGLELANPQLDTFELAILLHPGLPSYELQAIARELGIETPRPHRALSDALLARDVFNALCARAATLDPDVLGQIARLAGPLDWPLKLVFGEAQRVRVREMIQTGELGQRAGSTFPLPIAPPNLEATQPLKPADRPVPIDVEALVAALGPDGAIARCLDGFEHRVEQQQMARAVASTFYQGGTLVVEAGTGTGKSLGYLLPAVTYSTANGRPVVISTNTINLQDQLCRKDIPAVLRATRLPARVAVLKGRSNYLCLQRLIAMLRADELSAPERLLLIKTLLWLPWTQSGDRAELRLNSAEEEAWSRLAASAETCTPAHCRFHRDGICWLARARRRAEAAHLVIVNHSLLLADLMTGHQVLPEYGHLVVDEAHHLEDEATAQLGRRASQREVMRQLDHLDPRGPSTGLLGQVLSVAREIADAADLEAIGQAVGRAAECTSRARTELRHAFTATGQFVRAHARPGEAGQLAVRVTTSARAQPAWSELDVAWGQAVRAMLDLENAIGDVHGRLDRLRAREQAVSDALSDLDESLAFWVAVRTLANSVVAEQDPHAIAWIALSQADNVSLNLAPLEVGQILRDRLFGPRESVVLTSATLTVEGSFAYIRSRLGLEDADELAVGSPFHFASSALVYLPSDCPEPYQPGYQHAIERVILEVATALQGRTLVLFTSHHQLRAAYEALHDALDARRLILLAQGIDGASRNRLLETFKGGSPAVLMGTSSFWEGVDVVGEALSCLVMTRLPFSPPNDPVTQARAEQYDDPFTQYTLPQAALRFRQGFGRLIRSKSDRGIMVVTDGRLRTRGYRWAFLRSLPPCPVKVGPVADVGRIARQWVEGRIRL